MLTSRVSRLRPAVVVAHSQTKTQPFGIVIENNHVAHVVINFFADGELFKRAEIVDADCSSVRRWGIERRAGETTLQNWDTMIVRPWRRQLRPPSELH